MCLLSDSIKSDIQHEHAQNYFLDVKNWTRAAMSLSAKDKAVVKDLWAKVAPKADDIGAEALGR